jgi:hypothetical protein
MKFQKRTILIVDDDEDDLFLHARALKIIDTRCVIQALSSGEEAIAYLKGIGKYQDREKFQFQALSFPTSKCHTVMALTFWNFSKTTPSFR